MTTSLTRASARGGVRAPPFGGRHMQRVEVRHRRRRRSIRRWRSMTERERKKQEEGADTEAMGGRRRARATGVEAQPGDA